MNTITKNRLQRILETAYDQVPYFNNIINSIIYDDEDLTADFVSQLPIFDKTKIKLIGWENFLAQKYLNSKYKVVLDKGVHLERTSGTTGTPLSVLWDNNDYHASCINHWKFRSKNFDITPNSRMCTSTKSIPNGRLYHIDEKKNIFYFNIRELNEETISEIINGIYKFKPEWLYLQNSILYILVYYAEKMNLFFPDSIRYIEYMGEPICNYYRTRIKKRIPVDTSNMYGCVETNGISYECNKGHNHLLAENVIVEIVDINGNPVKNGENGFVCVTGLHNTAMPILRYRLNDVANIDINTVCECGNQSPIINIKSARMPEYLILDDPNIFFEADLFCPINSGLKLNSEHEDDIVFNLKMNATDNYELWVYQLKQKDINIEDTIHRIFKAYELPNIKFSVRHTDKIDHSKAVGILRFRK